MRKICYVLWASAVDHKLFTEMDVNNFYENFSAPSLPLSYVSGTKFYRTNVKNVSIAS